MIKNITSTAYYKTKPTTTPAMEKEYALSKKAMDDKQRQIESDIKPTTTPAMEREYALAKIAMDAKQRQIQLDIKNTDNSSLIEKKV